jgi:hypothetical protein
MGNFVSGIIALGLGLLILVGYLVGGGPQGENVYHATQFTGLVFSLLLLAAGVFFLARGIRGAGQRPRGQKRKKKSATRRG